MAKLYFYYSAMNAGKTTTLLQSAYNYQERGMRTLVLTPDIDTRGTAESEPPSGPADHLPPQAGEDKRAQPSAAQAHDGEPPSGRADHLPPQAGEDKRAQPSAAQARDGVVASRIGLKAAARRFGNDNLLQLVEADIAEHGDLHCVLVDEAQFLGRDQVWQLGDVVDRLHIPVLAYGLRTDFRGELFEGSRYLLAWADNLEEIKTICHSGRKATMVVRVDEQGRAVTAGPQVEIGGNDRYVSVSRAEFKNIMAGDGRIELKQSTLPLGEPR